LRAHLIHLLLLLGAHHGGIASKPDMRCIMPDITSILSAICWRGPT
jgi:hypothetical protein